MPLIAPNAPPLERTAKEYFVEVVNKRNGKVEKRLGPLTERRADQVDVGANRLINRDEFYTRIVTDEETPS